MSLFIYGTATNTGKGFFTHQDRQNFFLAGHPENVWVVGNNEKGAVWLASKGGIDNRLTSLVEHRGKTPKGLTRRARPVGLNNTRHPSELCTQPLFRQSTGTASY